MAEAGDVVSICQLCRWFDVPRRTFYYRQVKQKPKVNELVAARVKQFIERESYAGYRTIAHGLGLNPKTVQRINQLKGWQVKQRPVGFRPRARSMPSVAAAPNERWSTDMTRVWCGQQDRWAALSVVMDCHTREILGWRLTRNGNAKAAEATLEDALINRFGSLARLAKPLTLRSDNGLVFTSKRFTVTVQRYGLQQEFIQPHTPQQNGMIERLFRTMKEQCIWLTRFESLDEAKSAIGRWVDWYNHQRPHQALKMRTPAETYKLAA